MLHRRFSAVLGVMIPAATLFGGVKSAPVAITRDADASLLYRTLTADAFTLRWVMPERATRATLTVTGDQGYAAQFAGLAAPEQALALPALPAKADKEQVFTFTLAFDSGETASARVGAVCGVADGPSAPSCRCSAEGGRKWARTSRREVVPVAAGLRDFSLAFEGGTPQAFDPGLDGAAGWMRLPLGAHGAYTLAATGDDGDLSAAFDYVAGGLAFILR